ncbi:hypothetical protein ACJX0J_013171, partial [Zea mays]
RYAIIHYVTYDQSKLVFRKNFASVSELGLLWQMANLVSFIKFFFNFFIYFLTKKPNASDFVYQKRGEGALFGYQLLAI